MNLVSFELPKINLSLINHRPGANTSSIELLDFLLARYVRIRMQSMHKTERKFYSIRHLKIGGRLDCSGHASETNNAGDDVCILSSFKSFWRCGNACD